jgi:RNA polymerase sigma-70 factor (ECF subfamily)
MVRRTIACSRRSRRCCGLRRGADWRGPGNRSINPRTWCRIFCCNAPFAPWLFAIARNKLIDALRRRGRRVFVNIDDFAETIPSEPVAESAPASEIAARLQSLPARQRDVLQSIAVDSASIKDTAAKFAMTEGAVRVALHRGLASLTAKLRGQ